MAGGTASFRHRTPCNQSAVRPCTSCTPYRRRGRGGALAGGAEDGCGAVTRLTQFVGVLALELLQSLGLREPVGDGLDVAPGDLEGRCGRGAASLDSD